MVTLLLKPNSKNWFFAHAQKKQAPILKSYLISFLPFKFLSFQTLFFQRLITFLN